MLRRWKEKSGLSGASYNVLYEALCHKYIACKGLAEKFCIRESPDQSKKRKDCTSEWLKVRQILLPSSEFKRAISWSLARETPVKVPGTLILLWLEHRLTNVLFSPKLCLYSSYLWEIILRADKLCKYYRRRRTSPREKEKKKSKTQRWLSGWWHELNVIDVINRTLISSWYNKVRTQQMFFQNPKMCDCRKQVFE